MTNLGRASHTRRMGIQFSRTEKYWVPEKNHAYIQARFSKLGNGGKSVIFVADDGRELSFSEVEAEDSDKVGIEFL
jgi:hypothetical protein